MCCRSGRIVEDGDCSLSNGAASKGAVVEMSRRGPVWFALAEGATVPLNRCDKSERVQRVADKGAQRSGEAGAQK